MADSQIGYDDEGLDVLRQHLADEGLPGFDDRDILLYLLDAVGTYQMEDFGVVLLSPPGLPTRTALKVVEAYNLWPFV